MRYAPDPNEFCSECGERLTWFAADMAARCPNVRCKTNAVDWKRPMEPGPVRLPTREEIMADSRRARWQPIATIPDNRIVIVARQLRNNDRWTIDRFHPGDPLPPLVGAVERATHWAEDILGTP